MKEDDFHLIDLTNYKQHPTRSDIQVFFFRELERADYFEKLLKEKELFFEKYVEDEGNLRVYFGVKRSDMGSVKILNNLTIGKFREPFISNKFLRYFIIGLSALALSFVIVGAVRSL